ncbi:MAG: alpha-ketoglutarate-dependent dioxygenase AlkB [Myxococcota bacterium]
MVHKGAHCRGRLRDLGRGSWARLIPGFVADGAALMQQLLDTLPLRQEPITMFGKTHLTPRLTSWHGDPGCSYRYSRRLFEPSPWTPALSEVRARLIDATGYAFNSVLVNHYRDGRDAMGAHADDEPELGPARDDVGIGSISLGARRRFLLRPKAGGDTIEYALGEGDLLVMGGTTQAHFKHWIPRTAKPVGPRMNLTFRVVMTAA